MTDSIEHVLFDITNDKYGLEIGGPSSGNGTYIYSIANTLDNLVFSRDTIWAKQKNDTYPYGKSHNGHIFINDATSLPIVGEKYDFVFASHILEHIANPLKAIQEWIKVIKPNGYLILILPEKSVTFDHLRNVTPFTKILSQFHNNVGEDDLSMLPEILRYHDLKKDPPAGNFEHFTKRSLDNYQNRCLHHFVYDVKLLDKITNFFKLKFIYTVTKGVNIWYILQKN